MRGRLYRTALKLFARRGFEETTLRDISAAARVSTGLLYRYFPSKHAVVLALYDELSHELAARVERLPAGPWSRRALFVLRESLAVLGPHRDVLQALIPVVVSRGDNGLMGPGTAFSRQRVQGAFERAATGKGAPTDDTLALGRVLYLLHLAVILWWLLDESKGQRATAALVAMLERWAPGADVLWLLPSTRSVVRELDGLVEKAFPAMGRTHRGGT
ncbi:MAG: TetR/AcrR family transcriptional regulator [Myxococcota bacterium]